MEVGGAVCIGGAERGGTAITGLDDGGPFIGGPLIGGGGPWGGGP